MKHWHLAMPCSILEIDGHWLFGKEGQNLLIQPIGIYCWSGECCQQLLDIICGQGVNIPLLGENCGFEGRLLGFKNEGLRIGKDSSGNGDSIDDCFFIMLLVFLMLVWYNHLQTSITTRGRWANKCERQGVYWKNFHLSTAGVVHCLFIGVGASNEIAQSWRYHHGGLWFLFKNATYYLVDFSTG